MSDDGLARSHASSINYLDDRLLASYFEAREHETYYRSLKHADTRRDFHGAVIPVLMDLVGEILSAQSTQVLDSILASSATPRGGGEVANDPAEAARRLHPGGFDLLGIGDRLDFDTLKSSYRRSALRCHPDKGGSHEQMVLVNEAYSLFHEMLCRRRTATDVLEQASEGFGTGLEVPIRTTKDYLYVVGVLLLEIKLDEWSLDDAHYWVTMLGSDEWVESSYARHQRTRANLLFPCSTLAGRLWAAGLRDLAQEVYRVAEDSLRIARANDLYHGDGLQEADSFMKEGRKLRLVLNHRRQADNALRLGLIDQKRYKQTVERLVGKTGQADGQAEAMRGFIAQGVFLSDLPTDRVAKGKVVRSNLVPEPGYFDERIENLTDDQQAEYLRAYGPGTDLALVRKYVYVRSSSLLRSMILHDGDVDLPAMERESRSLGLILPQPANDSFNQVADVAHFLAGLDSAARTSRCDLLRQLDDKATDATTITMSLASGEVEQTDSTYRVRLHPEYLETVRSPLERLRLALRTGSTKTEDEQREERDTWNRDMGLINSPTVRESQKAVFESSDLAKDDPEHFIPVIKSHCEMLLGLGQSMVHVEQLQVGYYIERLTVALTRLKRWDEAKVWLDLYFALPERYRGRSSRSDVETMSKRLDRCVQQMAR